MVAVHFDISSELLDNIEALRIPCDHEHQFFAMDLMSLLCDRVVSRQSAHATQ
jgi:hypothetical protein